MYSYEIMEEEKKIIILKDGDVYAKMGAEFYESKVNLTGIEFSDDLLDEVRNSVDRPDPIIKLISGMRKKLSEVYASKGKKLEKVLFGELVDVANYDKYLTDTYSVTEQKKPSTSMR